MKTIKKHGEHFFQIHSNSNKDLGAFLLFLGIVGSAPLYYLASLAVNQPTEDLRPAIWIGLFFVIIGLYLIFYTKKRFWVNREKITMHEGLLRKKITYSCPPNKSIRLKNFEIEHRGAPVEVWQVFLECGKKEFLIHEKINAQLEIRQLAETLAKILDCPFEDLTFEDEGIVINSADLDLPYRDRVIKYPELLGKATKKPAKVYFTVQEVNNHIVFSWGIMTTRLLTDILFICVVIFILSLIPFSSGGLSFFQVCAANKDFTFYYTFAALFILTIFILGGYKITLILSPSTIEFKEHIWALLYYKAKINIRKIEEINTFVGIRGAKVQIISDDELIDINIYDQENARWLVCLIRQYLLNL